MVRIGRRAHSSYIHDGTISMCWLGWSCVFKTEEASIIRTPPSDSDIKQCFPEAPTSRKARIADKIRLENSGETEVYDERPRRLRHSSGSRVPSEQDVCVTMAPPPTECNLAFRHD
ncbi:hypothetical protein PC117_g10983 [Phytophthora cactorum]|uniref:Uncharacterized protein n=1 Tax=Phytophthora cactorum TaxID=29920 RepID=A0A8T1DEH5_9STRA|nr:hypothetical protein PC117_g10983 [Phytophthora cactorum]